MNGAMNLFRRPHTSPGRVLQENDLDILVITTHEFGHILQYKSGMSWSRIPISSQAGPSTGPG
jgi:hypothetical protein